MNAGPLMPVDTLYHGLTWAQLLMGSLMMGSALRSRDGFTRPLLPLGVGSLVSAAGALLHGALPDDLVAAAMLLGLAGTGVWFVRILRQVRTTA